MNFSEKFVVTPLEGGNFDVSPKYMNSISPQNTAHSLKGIAGTSW